MRRRVATRKRDIHREEQRRAKGAKPYMVLPTDTVVNGVIIVDGALKEEKPKPKAKPAAKKKAAPKKKVAPKKKAEKKDVEG